jgi:hypothetical protein
MTDTTASPALAPDGYSPTTGAEAFAGLTARIHAQSPVRARTLPFAEASRRGMALAAQLALPEVTELLPKLEVAGLATNLRADLRAASLALFHRASLLASSPTRSPSSARIPVTLVDEVLGLRRRLLDILAFALADNADVTDTLGRIRSGSGYLDSAQDLISLADLVRAHAARLASAVPLHYHPGLADDAERLSAQMLESLAGGSPTEPSEDIDQRLWGLFTQFFHEARAALTFIWRAQPDKLDTVPTLGAVRRPAPPRAPEPDAPELPA